MSSPLYSPDDSDAIALGAIAPDQAAELLGERVRALPNLAQATHARAFQRAIESGNVDAMARAFIDIAGDVGLIVMLRAPSRLLTVSEAGQ